MGEDRVVRSSLARLVEAVESLPLSLSAVGRFRYGGQVWLGIEKIKFW